MTVALRNVTERCRLPSIYHRAEFASPRITTVKPADVIPPHPNTWSVLKASSVFAEPPRINAR